MGEQSSSRLEGDRYQHLFSWYVILDLLDTERGIETVWVEHPRAGAADDVSVHPHPLLARPARYYQVKWHVDQRGGYSMAGLIEPGKGKSSLLGKLWESWRILQRAGDCEIWLVSNWSSMPGDLLGSLIQGKDYQLDARLLSAASRSSMGNWRRLWREHLGADADDFAHFYRALRFRLGFASIADLEEIVDRQMQACDLKSGEGARSIGIDQIRRWIEAGQGSKEITLPILKATLDRLDLWAPRGQEPYVAVFVHTWMKRSYDCQADYELDWSAHFDHQTRRVPDTATWNLRLLPELRTLERMISQQTSCRSIRLRGSLCLSAAFAVGHVFSVAGGYRIELLHRTETWRSETPPDPSYRLKVKEEPGESEAHDLLFALSVTGDARSEVEAFAQQHSMSFCACLYLSPEGGPHDFSVQGVAQASALARLARLELRKALADYRPNVTHLFYFGPQSVATLIGQKLNACGIIQLYEFQNPGYAPSFRLR
ncbi:MAG TPA: SAVED domain-containing protein [Ktedonobacteraceae bacterium]|nr:SAVED domain-containing protein [Ktedonobacteraceae bacterium]